MFPTSQFPMTTTMRLPLPIPNLQLQRQCSFQFGRTSIFTCRCQSFSSRVSSLKTCKRKSLSASASTSYNESFQPQGFSASGDHRNSAVNQQGQAGKVYVSHAIFKGKAALILQPKGPDFTALNSGGIKLSKEGVVFLAFVPAIGTRQYDWNKKQVFALSVVEIGTLLSLGPNESCEFFHDPSVGKSEEGNVRKVLKIVPMHDREGYSFILSVSNNIRSADDNFYVPVTKGEFAVMQSAFNFILPHLMGWHAIVESTKPDASSFSVW